MFVIGVLFVLVQLALGWEYSRVIAMDTATTGSQSAYAAVSYGSGSDVEREVVSIFKQKTDENGNTQSVGTYGVSTHDGFYNAYNVTNTYELKANDDTKYLQMGILNSEAQAYLVYGNGSGAGYRFLDVGTEEDADPKDNYDANAWNSIGNGVISSGFDFFLTDSNNKNILIVLGNFYYADTVANIAIPTPRSKVPNDETVIAAAISHDYFVLGTSTNVYIGKFSNPTEALTVLGAPIVSENYSLAINSSYVFLTYLKYDEKQEVSTYEVSIKSCDISNGIKTCNFNDNIFSPIPFTDLLLENYDDILECYSNYGEKDDADPTNIIPNADISVNVVQTSFADDSFLIISLPKCGRSIITTEAKPFNYSLTVTGYHNLYYNLGLKALDPNEIVDGLEDLTYASIVEVSYSRDANIAAPTTPYKINMRVMGLLSGEVFIINNLMWNKFFDTLPDGITANIKSTTAVNPLVFRSCNRKTYNYPICSPRSFVGKFENEEDLPGCPIQYDGYYCDVCASKYSQTGSDESGPLCEKCSGFYFGPRCSASTIGVILLAIVYGILMLGCIISYLVNRKK